MDRRSQFLRPARVSGRYEYVAEEKSGGATYTPKELADFVASQIVQASKLGGKQIPIRVLDPAVGHGELLASLLEQLPKNQLVEIYGFDTNEAALRHTAARLQASFPEASIRLQVGDFLRFVLDMCGGSVGGGLFDPSVPETYDVIIANPPYVRTQIIGAEQARRLAKHFELTGRVDMYYAFILAMAKVLRPHGVAGIIVSNRFMTTKAGATVRQAIRERFNLRHVWDLGDTKLFDAAVLPVVILAEGRNGQSSGEVAFTSVYETRESAANKVRTAIEALDRVGVVEVVNGRRFHVRQGRLDESEGFHGIWRLATVHGESWLQTVQAHTWRTFGELGKIRVGVKTCDDDVFIRTDWDELPETERPELLRTLATHHVARRFKADKSKQRHKILYPHESVGGKRRTIDLDMYPRSKAYLESHRIILEGRRYVLEAQRKWYEIWVPQDPKVWEETKLVFRDISEQPCFWIDQEGSVVNGDCYWMTCNRKEDDELLWMAAAVGNSSFIEAFYDQRFNNKLYAGRRRFITQYVEKFPLPDPKTSVGKAIVVKAKAVYDARDTQESERMEAELNQLVWQAFGLDVEKVLQ